MTIRRRTLPRLLSVVRPGGLFYARIPCVASLFRILQCIGLPVDFTYPTHFHDMAKTYWSSILRLLPPPFQHYSVVWSCPSIVETTLRKNPMRTVAAYVMKAPWRILRQPLSVCRRPGSAHSEVARVSFGIVLEPRS